MPARGDNTPCWHICCHHIASRSNRNATRAVPSRSAANASERSNITAVHPAPVFQRLLLINPGLTPAPCHSIEPTKAPIGRLPGQSLDTPLGFVHVTKGGGTVLEAYLGCPDLRCHGHTASAIDWQRRNMDSLVVIRNPIDRFISNFHYARLGSDVHFGAEMRLPGKHTSDFLAFPTAGHMVDALAKPDAGANTTRATRVAWSSIVKREGGLAFARQAHWLRNATPGRLHVVCYDEHRLSERVQAALRAAGSNCSIASLPVINKTGKRVATGGFTAHNQSAVELTAEQAAWVSRQYADDVVLYREHCEPELPRLAKPEQPQWDWRWDPQRRGRSGWTDWASAAQGR